MKTKAIHRLFVLLIVFSFSCSFVTGLTGGSGPKNFTAALSAPDVVLLTWDAVEGATGYILELSIDNGESIQFVELPPELTSYEDISAPEKSNLTYQVQVVTESGPAGKSKIDIATGAREPNPLTVKPAYDEKSAVVETIGAQGGTVSLMDSNKVEYTLVIPMGALSTDTEIHMTAVSTIQDLPLDGNEIGAVRLEPEGLVLNDAAILTISIPVDINPGLGIVGFAFQGDGTEFHLQLSDQEKGLTNNSPLGSAHLASAVFQEPIHRIRMPVGVLRVNGVGQASGNNAAELVKNNAASDSGAALEQKWAAEAIADDALAPLVNTKGWKALPKERMQGQEIAKHFANAKDCKELTGLMGSLNNWENTLSWRSLNLDQQQQYSRPAWDALADKIKDILQNTATECEKSSQPGSSAPAESPCAKALLERITNPGSSGFNQELQAKMGLKFKDNELHDIKGKLDKCVPKAYHIFGTLGDISEDGYACDATKPFTVDGDITMVFAPTDEKSGKFLFTGGPFGDVGGGSYTIGNGSMQITGSGCVDPSGTFCNIGGASLTATPVDPATCVSQ